MPEKFDLIVRAVILKDDEILLCRKKEEDFYFFPGGHIEMGEKAELAIVREVLEETGISVGGANFIGVVENFFMGNEKKIHEINLVFATEISVKKVNSAEDHLEFCWVGISRLQTENILPIVLKERVIKWLRDKKCFWGSQDL